VYHEAKKNPTKLYIGIDSNSKPLEKISTKINRKPAKGGAANVLYVQAAAENLPEELNGIVNEVHVLFPWGSLLRTIATGDPDGLANIKRICAANASIRILFAIEKNKDQSEIERLALPELTMEYLNSVLVHLYELAGFDVTQANLISFSDLKTLPTTWAKRLQQNKNRSVFLLTAVAH
jgi:16S rRNA (adenine(1408)-N(1))-methyltransferase